MTLKSDNHALKALAEEVGGGGTWNIEFKPINLRTDGLGKILQEAYECAPRIQDGTSYFHGVYNND